MMKMSVAIVVVAILSYGMHIYTAIALLHAPQYVVDVSEKR